MRTADDIELELEGYVQGPGKFERQSGMGDKTGDCYSSSEYMSHWMVQKSPLWASAIPHCTHTMNTRHRNGGMVNSGNK